jgi:hypothetical protein
MGNMHVHHSICDCGVAGYFWMASQPGGYYRIPQYCFSINDLISRSYTLYSMSAAPTFDVILACQCSLIGSST